MRRELRVFFGWMLLGMGHVVIAVSKSPNLTGYMIAGVGVSFLIIAIWKGNEP